MTKSASPFRPGDVIKVEHASHDWHYVVLDMSDTSSIELELICFVDVGVVNTFFRNDGLARKLIVNRAKAFKYSVEFRVNERQLDGTGDVQIGTQKLCVLLWDAVALPIFEDGLVLS